jgi:hypothetical protein
VQDVGDRRRALGSEVLRGVLALPLAEALDRPAVGVPRVVEEELQRQLVVLHVADVDDPQAVDAVLVGLVQLVPDVGQLVGVDPLVVAPAADVVVVVVEAVAAAARGQVAVGQLADVAPVVVGEDDGDVIGRAQALVPVALDLLVQGPHLRNARLRARLLGDDPALGGEDALHQLDAVAVGEADVAVAAHAERHDALEALVAHAPDAVAPVRLDRVGVAAEAPLAVAAVRVVARRGVAVPLLDAAHHRGLVRGAHDDAVGLAVAWLAGSSSANARPHTAGQR